MKAIIIFFAIGTMTALAAEDGAFADAAPAEDAARMKAVANGEIPLAPPKYRRPPNYQPILYPRSLQQLADEESAQMMARAKTQVEKVRAVNAAGKYKGTGLSIDSHKCPEWFIDAKLGMFIDWGLYSIASYVPYIKGARLYPDWYEQRAFMDFAKDSGLYGYKEYHIKNWGEDFKRDHFIDLFRGRDFDAEKLMALFKRCGARYVVPFLKHHSGFCEWDCSYTFRDSVDQGAKRDFAKEMADACRKEGLKFGIYNSQAEEWEYPILQDDGSIKMHIWGKEELRPWTSDMEWKASGKVAVKNFAYDYIVPQMTEFIDKYDPDILWYDADWATRATENGSYEITAYLYNRAEGRKEVCCNDRYGRLDPAEEAAFKNRGIRLIGVRTIRGDFYTDEWGDCAENIDPAKWHPWESCSGISKSYGNHWMEEYDPSMVMTDREFIIHFMDIVARGGNLLLLVNLDGQGAMPKVQVERLESIGRWLKRYGEAVYATRILAPFSTPTVDYTKAKDDSAFFAVVKESSAEVALECEIAEGAKISVVGDESGEKLAYRREGKRTIVKVPMEYASATLPYALKIVK